MTQCCEKCLNNKFALKGKVKEKFGGICGIGCDCHWPNMICKVFGCGQNSDGKDFCQAHDISNVQTEPEAKMENNWRESIHGTLKTLYFKGLFIPQVIIDAIDAAYLQGLEDGRSNNGK